MPRKYNGSKRDGEQTRRNMVRFIAKYIRDNNGRSPNMREIADGAGISTTSIVSYHVDILEDEKRITRVPRQARSIRLIE